VTNLGADVVTLVTSENGKEAKIEIDVPELIRSVDKVKDVMLKNGDVIYVPRYPVFYIHGEVQRPGQYRLERDMTVEQALAVGGELTWSAVLTRYEALLDAWAAPRPRRTPATGPPDRET
jgi:protein involved in polysaccharide export with SLBB domain